MRCKNWRNTMLARTDADAAEAAKPSPVADHACFGSMHGSSAERHLIGQQGHAVEHKKRRHSWWPTVSIHAMSLLLVLKPFYNHEDICMQPHVPSLLNHTVLHHGYGHSPFCPRNQKEHEKQVHLKNTTMKNLKHENQCIAVSTPPSTTGVSNWVSLRDLEPHTGPWHDVEKSRTLNTLKKKM